MSSLSCIMSELPRYIRVPFHKATGTIMKEARMRTALNENEFSSTKCYTFSKSGKRYTKYSFDSNRNVSPVGQIVLVSLLALNKPE